MRAIRSVREQVAPRARDGDAQRTCVERFVQIIHDPELGLELVARQPAPPIALERDEKRLTGTLDVVIGALGHLEVVDDPPLHVRSEGDVVADRDRARLRLAPSHVLDAPLEDLSLSDLRGGDELLQRVGALIAEHLVVQGAEDIEVCPVVAPAPTRRPQLVGRNELSKALHVRDRADRELGDDREVPPGDVLLHESPAHAVE